MIQDIIIQYLHTCPNSDLKLDCWNRLQKNEDAVRYHLSLYDQYQEEFMEDIGIFHYCIDLDYSLLREVQHCLKRLFILKKLPLYKRIFQEYQELFKTVRLVGKRKPPGKGKGHRIYYDWDTLWNRYIHHKQ